MTGACEIMCLDVNGMADGNDGPYKDEARYMAGKGNPPIKLGKQDADIIWIYDLVDQLGICPHDLTSCSPVVDGRFLYIVSGNGVNQPHEKCLRPDAPSFICLDTQTGKLLATDTEGLGHRMWHCLWSPPSMGVVNGKKLVFFGGADGICYAFEALTAVPSEPIHFKKVWQYDCDPPSYRFPNGQKPFNYYIGDRRKKYSTNKNDGKFLGPSEIISSPVFHDGKVYVTIGQDPTHGRGRGLLHCIDASKPGDITQSGCVWTYDGIERTIASVAISDGLLYAVDLAGPDSLPGRGDRQAVLGVRHRLGNLGHAAGGRRKSLCLQQKGRGHHGGGQGGETAGDGAPGFSQLRHPGSRQWDAVRHVATFTVGGAEGRDFSHPIAFQRRGHAKSR